MVSFFLRYKMAEFATEVSEAEAIVDLPQFNVIQAEESSGTPVPTDLTCPQCGKNYKRRWALIKHIDKHKAEPAGTIDVEASIATPNGI